MKGFSCLFGGYFGRKWVVGFYFWVLGDLVLISKLFWQNTDLEDPYTLYGRKVHHIILPVSENVKQIYIYNLSLFKENFLVSTFLSKCRTTFFSHWKMNNSIQSFWPHKYHHRQLSLKSTQAMVIFTLVSHTVSYLEYFCQYVHSQKVLTVLSACFCYLNLDIFYMSICRKQNENWDYCRYSISCGKSIPQEYIVSWDPWQLTVDCHLGLEALSSDKKRKPPHTTPPLQTHTYLHTSNLA